MNTARPRLVHTRKFQLTSSPSKRAKSSSDESSPPPTGSCSSAFTMTEAAGTAPNEDLEGEEQPPTKFTEADLQAIKLTSDTLKVGDLSSWGDRENGCMQVQHRLTEKKQKRDGTHVY